MAKTETTMASRPSEYQPGTYVKGDSVRTASTAADAVAFVFDGYTRKADESPKATPKSKSTPSTDS